MVAKAKLAEVVKSHPAETEAALAAIQRDADATFTMAGVEVAARQFRSAPEVFLIETLVGRRLLTPFVQALEARGVDIGRRVPRTIKTTAQERPPRWVRGPTSVSKAAWNEIGNLYSRVRCRVSVNGVAKGSGCLIGPSLVLTAWHVVATGPPDEDLPLGAIEVHLANGRREPALPTLVYESRCTPDEYKNKYPKSDADYQDRHDVALVRLQRPEGIRLGYARLPAQPVQPSNGSPLFLMHYPGGKDIGITPGFLKELSGLTLRWGHSAPSKPGSSGGACFDHEPRLIGIHQGLHKTIRRLVPVNQFLNEIRDRVENDIAPQLVWALDGEIIVGRDPFFEAVAAASREATRLRGLRIKRQEPAAQGATGLNFSARMLEHVLQRSLGAHAMVRISFDAMAPDLLREIARQGGLDDAQITDLQPNAGVKAGETMPPATARASAQKLAEALDTAATQHGKILWLFFENPPRSLNETERVLLEAFLGVAIYRLRLRVVVAGFETMTTPGDEFPSLATATDGPPGFFVEVFGPIEKRDVEVVLERANKDLNARRSDDVIASMAEEVLQGFTPVNRRYAFQDLEAINFEIAKKIRVLRRFAEHAA